MAHRPASFAQDFAGAFNGGFTRSRTLRSRARSAVRPAGRRRASLAAEVAATLATAIEPLEQRVLMSSSTVAPLDIDGTQPVALDQPQINTIFRTSPDSLPLGWDQADSGVFVTAYLDTGTSGMLLSQESADALGITGTTAPDGTPVQFTDVGIGGGEAFDVSSPLYGSLAPNTSLYTTDLTASDFTQSFGPTSIELNPTPADDLIGPLDIIGMPAMDGKVVVMDPTPLAATDPNNLDSMRTYVYAPGTPFDAGNSTTDPGIPNTNFHVQLSYGDFSRFTTVTPTGAPGPTLDANPFFGPNPLTKLDPTASPGNSPPITITQGSASTTGSFLFDTGAAASFISTSMASAVGVHYQPGTYNSDNPVLLDANNNPVPNQFVLPLGGIGGSINAAGFYLSSLTIPTQEGEPIRFLNAPVLVADVTVQDPASGKTLTLDGDMGMNFFVPSLDVSGLTGSPTPTPTPAPTPTPTSGSAAPFDWVTFDQPNGVLGLDVVGVTPPPALVGGVAVSGSTSVATNQPQRSEVRNLTVSFNEPITPSAGAFSLQLLNTGGSGLNDGSAPTDASAALGTPVAVAGSNGTQWSIPVLANTTFSDSSGSLTDGTYQIVVHASQVTATATGTAMANDFTTPAFHRLFGDVDGNGSVNAADYAKFKTAFGTATGSTAYNSFFDFDGSGSINTLDYAQFKKRFGLTFS